MKDNFLKINDLFTFSLLNPELVQIKDDFDNKKGIFDSEQEAKGLKIRIAATHAGIVTRNNMFYLPDKVKKGVATFTKDYNKPILLHHDEEKDAIGRIVDAFYVDTSRFIKDNYSNISIKDSGGNSLSITDEVIQKFCDGSMPLGMQVEVVRNLFARKLQDGHVLVENKSYEGLGHIQIIADITDPDAIQKFLDGRHLTGSIGATTDQAICSICKHDWMEDGSPCEHDPGAIYDDVKMVLIAGNFEYGEYSVANMPADRHSKVLELYYNGNVKNIEIKNECAGNICEVRPEFPQYVIEEERMAKDAKKNTKEIQDSVQDEVEICNCEEEKSLEQLLDTLLKGEELSDEDKEYLYDMIFSKDEKPEDVDWDKISVEMEEYAVGLEDVEDKVLEGFEEPVKDAEKKSKDKPGGSNVGKYKKGPFCGPAGGAPKGSYPVNTLKRAKAALSYARHAPNPAGIRKCVCAKWGKQLPSCQKKKDHVNPRKSVFCGPQNTFPVVDCEDAATIKSILTPFKDKEGVDKILKNTERKAKAFGCFKKVRKTKDNLGHARMLHMVTAVMEEHMWTKPSAEKNGQEPLLADDEVKSLSSILKRLAVMVGKDSFVHALSDEDSQELKNVVKTFQDVDLLDEIMELEEKLGEVNEEFTEVRDSRDALREEYDLLQGEVDSLRDELVQGKNALRDVKVQNLDILVSLRDGTSEEDRKVGFVKLTDEVLDSKLEELGSEVDINKIADTINNGTSRIPEGSVKDPTVENTRKQFTSKEDIEEVFEKIQEQYMTRAMRNKINADDWLNMKFEEMINDGQFPEELVNQLKENIRGGQ
jgi:uncharacterized coiled-coil DUF342 family protein